MEGLNIDQLAAILGDYARMHQMQLYGQVFQQVQFENLLSTISDVDDEITVTLDEIDEVTQGYQGVFTPKGNVDFTPRIFKLRDIKINYNIKDVKKLQKSHLSWLFDANVNIADMPIVQFIFNQRLFQKAAEENEYVYVWDGLYKAPTANQSNAASEVVDGFGTVLNAIVRAGEVAPVAIGEINESNAEAKVRQFCDMLPEPFKSQPGDIYCSPQVFGWYMDDYVTTYGQNANFEGFTSQVMGRNKRLVAVKAMKSATCLWMTPSWNRKKLMSKANNFNNLFVKRDHYGIELSCDWSRGYGVIDSRYLFISDGSINNAAHSDSDITGTFTFLKSLAARQVQSSALTVTGDFTAEDTKTYGFKPGYIKTRKRTGEVVASTTLLDGSDASNAEMQHLVNIGYGGLVQV